MVLGLLGRIELQSNATSGARFATASTRCAAVVSRRCTALDSTYTIHFRSRDHRAAPGVQSMLASHELLLTDEALMGVLGFNAMQVQHGSTERGASRRTEPVGIRGPFSYETVADNIVKLGPEQLEAMFNGVIRCIAAQGIFPKQIDAILDATDNEATPRRRTRGAARGA